MKWMLALCLCAGLGCQATQSASMDPLPKWEYHMFSITILGAAPVRDRTLFLEEFNRLGAEGWEYVDTYKNPLSEPSVLFRRRKQ